MLAHSLLEQRPSCSPIHYWSKHLHVLRMFFKRTVSDVIQPIFLKLSYTMWLENLLCLFL